MACSAVVWPVVLSESRVGVHDHPKGVYMHVCMLSLAGHSPGSLVCRHTVCVMCACGPQDAES
jgi:hypothetical protein